MEGFTSLAIRDAARIYRFQLCNAHSRSRYNRQCYEEVSVDGVDAYYGHAQAADALILLGFGRLRRVGGDE